jgi:single-strand DNA-binding protein
MGVNKVNLVGRLGKDPELRYADKNTPVVRIRIAVKDCDYDADGNKGKHTAWINVVLWNRLAFVAKNRLYKGAVIAIEGKVVNHNYVDKDGVKHYMLEVEANSIEWLSPKKTSATKESSSDANIAKVELENVLGSIEEKGIYETFGDMAIEKSALECQEPDASDRLSIKDVEMPKKRGCKKKSDELPK